MKILCAWWGKDMGEEDGRGVEGTSHGICEECMNKHFPRITMPEPDAFFITCPIQLLSPKGYSQSTRTHVHSQRRAQSGYFNRPLSEYGTDTLSQGLSFIGCSAVGNN